MKLFVKYLIVIMMSISIHLFAQTDTNMALISAGTYVPLYGNADKSPVSVSEFYIDKYPVTNEQFLLFVKSNSDFTKSSVKRLFAEKNYLYYWENDFDFGNYDKNAAVTNVSWFAANRYCECQGKRLATMDEWEYVGMANDNTSDARTKEEFNKYILSWYEQPKTYLNPVGSTFKNYWGVYDMHGLIWEWTADFNSIFLSGESRKDKDTDRLLFCGSGSVNASDLMDYAAFMRYAFRGSIKANYTTRNLGFRCAKDKENKTTTTNLK